VIALLGVVAAIPAALQVVSLGRLLWVRLLYPYDLHLVEGVTLLNVHRLLHGQAIYPEVTENAGFLGAPYPPLLYFVIAAIGGVFGFDYWTGRLVAILATATSALLLAREVYLEFRERRLPLPWLWPLSTLGAIAAAFPVTVAWYDAPMCDPLGLALAVAAALVVLPSASTAPFQRRRLVAAVVLMTAIVFTKQNYAAFVAWLLVFLFIAKRRQGLIAAAAVLASTGALLAVAQLVTRGSFYYYVISQLLHHPFALDRLPKALGLVLGFAPYLPVVLACAALLAVKRCLSPRALLWTGMLVTAFPVGLVPHLKWGGGDNNFMPIVVLAPAATFCVLADLCQLLARDRARALVLIASALGTGGYLLAHRYSPVPFHVYRSRRTAALELNRFVASLNGDVLIPSRPLLAIRNGSKVEQIQVMGYFDLLFGGRLDITPREFLRRTRPRYILLSDQEPGNLVAGATQDYFLRGLLPPATWPAQTLEEQREHYDREQPYYPGQLKWILERNSPDPPGSHCLFEFESSSYAPWVATGNAFGPAPTTVSSQKGRTFIAPETFIGVVGESFASSWTPSDGNRALGTLTSPVFVLDRAVLSLRFAGGLTELTRVELLVDGQPRFWANGRGNNYLELIEWRIDDLRGKPAQLKLIDEDPDAHLMLDHVCLGG